MGKISRIDQNPEWFREQARQSVSFSDLRNRLGYSNSPGVNKFIRIKFKKYKIDDGNLKAWKAKGLTRETSPIVEAWSQKTEKPFDECFKVGSSVGNKCLFIKLMRLGIKTYQCEICKRCEWNNLPIPLQVHHKNGINDDNRVENLEILCSNCHDSFHGYALNAARIAGRLGILDNKLIEQAYSAGKLKTQTEMQKTTSGRCQRCKIEFTGYPNQKFCTIHCSNYAQRRLDRPKKEEIEQLLKDGQGLASIARKYSVCPASVKKWTKQYGIIIPKMRSDRIPERPCQQCLTLYKPSGVIQKYCSIKCHGLARQKRERPTAEELRVLMQTESYRTIGKRYGVGHKTVMTWARYHGIYNVKRKVFWTSTETSK